VKLDTVRRIADAVLYEGYVLYPYRASAQKNRSRWQFGVVMPPGYAAADESENAVVRTECVFEHDGQPAVRVLVRFLQVQRRFRGQEHWDEAVEREVVVPAAFQELLGDGRLHRFVIPGGEDREPAGQAVRRREELAGAVTVTAAPVPGPWQAARLAVRVENLSAADPAPRTRDEALPSALVAAHVIIGVSGGQFISMTDPPQWAAAEVAACQNAGAWPVLAGEDGGADVMLCAPIILYDHPELAPESPGDLYDGTEIDEILTLRTLAMTDEEKREARDTDPRAAALIDRVEAMDAETLGRLHGTVRFPRAGPEAAAPWWDPDADAAVSPDTDAVTIDGRRVARGSRVVLRPGVRRSDAQDMFLAGRVAVVEAVLFDVSDAPYFAVSLADDPDADVRSAHGRFLYFMPDEVEPCEAGTKPRRGRKRRLGREIKDGRSRRGKRVPARRRLRRRGRPAAR
jgi:hypothetical protein